jgi:hypothetical protein
MKTKINKLKSNESNPRYIKGDKFKKLVESIKQFPEMLDLRPIVVDEDMIILGGNMRYKACIEAGLKEVPIKIAKGLTDKQKQEFIIKDNVGFGEWDWSLLANDWDNKSLGDWGLDVWQPEEEVDYSILDDIDLDMTLEDKEKNVMRGIVVEFEPQYYDEASALIKKAREKGQDVGLIVLKALRK